MHRRRLHDMQGRVPDPHLPAVPLPVARGGGAAVSDRLTPEQVAEVLSAYTPNAFMWRLACEVLASRKLIADLRALPYTAVTCELLRQMIDEAGL